MLAAVVDELFIDLVGDDVELLFHGQRGDLLKRFTRDHAAEGVAGAVEDKHLGLVGDARRDLLGADDEAVLVVAGHEHRHAAHHLHHLGIADPVGRGDEHLVARVAEGERNVQDTLLATNEGLDFRSPVKIHVIPSLVITSHRLAQLRDAHRRLISVCSRVMGYLAERIDGLL